MLAPVRLDGASGDARRLERARAARAGGVILGAVVLVFQLLVWLPRHAQRTDIENLDFPVYFRAATTAREIATAGSQASLYAECARYRAGYPPSCYLYPPPLAVALAPVAALGAHAFQVIWYAAILVAFWSYAFALVRLTGLRPSAARVLSAGAIIALTPGTGITMSFGNADLMVWALCALALDGGPLAGLATAFKVYPGWTIVAAFVRRERSFFRPLGALALCGLTLAACVYALGMKSFHDWSAALAVLTEGPRTPRNISVPVAVLRLAGVFGFHGTGRVFLTLAPLLGVPAVIWSTRRLARELQGGIVLVAALLLAPLCWWYYAPALLMPAAAWLRVRAAARPAA